MISIRCVLNVECFNCFLSAFNFNVFLQQKALRDREDKDKKRREKDAQREREKRDKAAAEQAKKRQEEEEQSKKLNGRMLTVLKKLK